MSLLRLILRDLLFYLRKNILLSLGISISTAVLTGALIVGDSVDTSLRKIAEERLGNITHMVRAGERYFTTELAKSLSSQTGDPVSPVLVSRGMAIADGGKSRIEDISIYGIDNTFDLMAGSEDFYSSLTENQVIISSNTAIALGVKEGDEILLRIRRASLVPLNAPFISDRENTVSSRLSIAGIAGRDEMGAFNLENSQTAPFNAFISLSKLNRMMAQSNRANLLLLKSSVERSNAKILESISNVWTTKDASLTLTELKKNDEIQVSSERVFIDQKMADSMKVIPGFKYPVITYFVNELSTSEKSTPYSFVSSLPENAVANNEIIVNKWLASDLGLDRGDSIRIQYFTVGPLRELNEESKAFIIKSIVEMKGLFADRDLMPHLPGLSDAGNCRDWETGVPINLGMIREKDEKYWDEWRGTPKAFISLPKAKEIWNNRFGTYTAFRFSSEEISINELESLLSECIDPSQLGFEAKNVRDQALKAAGEGVDFSELFAGLSFFLLAAGILLGVLLFLLNLEFRKDQLSTLTALGIPFQKIRRIIFTENFIIAISGALLGLLLAILYNQAIFSALNGIWKDIVRTDMLVIHISTLTLTEGFFMSLLISSLSILLPLNNFLRKNIRRKKTDVLRTQRKEKNKIHFLISLTALILAVCILTWEIVVGLRENAALFFVAGGLLLIAGIFGFRSLLYTIGGKNYTSFQALQLSLKNIARNPVRSIAVVILFAIATFLVISTGSNRKDLFINAEDPKSGTGGFLFYGESTIPVLHDLNIPATRYKHGMSGDYSFVQFRKSEGDDASCLNMNRIQNPAIISTDPASLKGRFSFQSRTKYLNDDYPWMSLESDLNEDLIPAIADETVIKWGLGKKVGDTLHYKNSMGESMQLLLIGGLAPSIFQGNVIIANKYFLKNFPDNSGTSVFLIEGSTEDSTVIRNEIKRGLRDYGLQMSLSAVRLAEFNSISNTYLSIFLVLGAIGLFLGTIGLGIVLFRSILERKTEIALYKAMGFKKSFVIKIISREYYFLLISGIGIGFLAAIIATLPSILSPTTGISFSSLILLLLILLLNGMIWILLMTVQALKNKKIYTSLRND